jgi:tetratricopeptide (TPR) repeat protein
MGRTIGKSPKKPEATLDEVSDLIRQGNLSQLPSTLSVDLTKISKEQYWTLMELLRHHSFGGSLIKRQHEIENVVELRNLVNAGKFSDAESKLQNSKLAADPEGQLEKARILVFSGKYPETIALCLLCLAEPSLEMTTRGVMSQLAGHAFLEIGELKTSKAYLDSALDIATSVGNTNGQISAWLFLAKQAAFEGQFEEANFHAKNACETIIETNSNSRWLLGYVRTIAQIEAIKPGGTYARTLSLYFLGERMARFLGDSLYETRCRLEAALVSLKKMSDDEIDLLLNQARRESRFSESDLAVWISAIENGSLSEASPLTLKRLMHSSVSKNLDGEASGLFSDFIAKYGKASWAFDIATGLLIDFVKESYTAIAPDSPTARIIEALAESPNQKMKQEELFETN